MEASATSHAPTANVRLRRRRLLTFIVLTLAGVILVLFDAVTGQIGLFSLFSPSGPTLQVSSPICGTWELKPVPFPGVLSQIELDSIATSPSGTIWVVGDTTNLGEGYRPAMSRWEGNRWRMIGLPDVNKVKAYLASAQFITDRDGWAVGHALWDGPGIIAMHWNGQNWNLSPTPPVLGALYRVRASSANDVWAVGWQYLKQAPETNPLVIHWNGSTWQVVNLPSMIANTNATLYDVLPLSRDNVWVVGGYNWPTPKEPLIWHWDGENWNIVPAQMQCSGQHDLVSLSAASTTDIWAVGSCDDGDPTVTQKLAEHWDGTRWTISEVANQEKKLGSLMSVVALSTNDVWSVGTHDYDGVHAFVQHWDGSNWKSIPGPPVTLSPQTGREFVSVSSNEFWLLGDAYSGYNPIVARFVRCH